MPTHDPTEHEDERDERAKKVGGHPRPTPEQIIDADKRQRLSLPCCFGDNGVHRPACRHYEVKK